MQGSDEDLRTCWSDKASASKQGVAGFYCQAGSGTPDVLVFNFPFNSRVRALALQGTPECYKRGRKNCLPNSCYKNNFRLAHP